MKLFLFFVLCAVGVNFSFALKETYKAGVIRNYGNTIDLNSYSQLILEAAKINVDILVVPFSQENEEKSDSYDEIVKTISASAKQGRVYVATNVLERARCQNKNELIRTSLVFDREGEIISVYRKPVSIAANCTSDSSHLETFDADFGVKFAILMEEDLVLQNAAEFKDVKNFIVVGSHATEIPFLNAQQFIKSWTYTTQANAVTPYGVYSGRVESIATEETVLKRLLTAELKINGEADIVKTEAPVVTLAELPSYPGEDLSQYIIRPLDLEASRRGYRETVCHKQFCCQFYVKTGFTGPKAETTYGLAAFSGIRHLGSGHYIGADICAVFACAGLYKRSCDIGSKKNTTNVFFEKINITSKFTPLPTSQFPVILTADASPVNFKLERKTGMRAEKVTLEIENSKDLLSFGIFGRNFGKDYYEETFSYRNEKLEWSDEFYEFFFNEDMQAFFDYVWIRIRVLMFVVSIYILEMM